MMKEKIPKKFKARVFYLYSDKLHAWLSEKDTWTLILWEARPFYSFSAVKAVFESESLPDEHRYFDCEIFSVQGIWTEPPGSMRRLKPTQ
jgi:hypothetical protein